MGIPMFGRIRGKFQCLQGLGWNSSVLKDNFIIPMFGRIRWEFLCLEG